WLMITVFSLVLMYQSEKFSAAHLWVSGILCCSFMLFWLVSTLPSERLKSNTLRASVTLVTFVNIIAIYFYIPYSFVAILMVIFSGIMPYYMSIKRAFFLSPLWALPLYLVYTYYWQQSGVGITAFLFWTFNLFALIMVNTGLRERQARLQTELINSQLIATQSLLNEAVKQGERVRIARNIHDLLGHHLTALTINLQVASRKSSGEVKESIDQCHQLSKLLLSDVREAVSDIRDKGKLDLQTSIDSILAALPTVNAQLNIDPNINVSDIHVADTIVKCIQESVTNNVKHAQGTMMQIDLALVASKNGAKALQLVMSNDGKIPVKIVAGNGLTGIKERVRGIGGEVDFAINNKQFVTTISIPVGEHD
ncbi:MAG: histidine kinase, partial [Glaciecola sp.]